MADQQQQQRQEGAIRKIFNEGEKRFGFINGDDGVSYFFVPSFVQQGRGYMFKDLRVGDRLRFSPTPSDKGPQAQDVIKITAETVNER